jgi:hypothetical protein
MSRQLVFVCLSSAVIVPWPQISGLGRQSLPDQDAESHSMGSTVSDHPQPSWCHQPNERREIKLECCRALQHYNLGPTRAPLLYNLVTEWLSRYIDPVVHTVGLLNGSVDMRSATRFSHSSHTSVQYQESLWSDPLRDSLTVSDRWLPIVGLAVATHHAPETVRGFLQKLTHASGSYCSLQASEGFCSGTKPVCAVGTVQHAVVQTNAVRSMNPESCDSPKLDSG